MNFNVIFMRCEVLLFYFLKMFPGIKTYLNSLSAWGPYKNRGQGPIWPPGHSAPTADVKEPLPNSVPGAKLILETPTNSRKPHKQLYICHFVFKFCKRTLEAVNGEVGNMLPTAALRWREWSSLNQIHWFLLLNCLSPNISIRDSRNYGDWCHRNTQRASRVMSLWIVAWLRGKKAF